MKPEFGSRVYILFIFMLSNDRFPVIMEKL